MNQDLNREEYLKKISELVLGELVVVSTWDYSTQHFEVRKVEKLTNKLIVLDNNLRFNKENGRVWGGNHGRTPYLLILTPEVGNAVRKYKLIRSVKTNLDKVKSLKLDELSTDTLSILKEVLEKTLEKK
jgi:hypothetical protein